MLKQSSNIFSCFLFSCSPFPSLYKKYYWFLFFIVPVSQHSWVLHTDLFGFRSPTAVLENGLHYNTVHHYLSHCSFQACLPASIIETHSWTFYHPFGRCCCWGHIVSRFLLEDNIVKKCVGTRECG